ncbi:MAG: Rpn family recombination-promoting nuclease/putative transposase [Floccifex sp.]
MLDFRNDILFRYVFGNNSKESQIALSEMLEAFIECPIENLQILSPVLVSNTMYTKETRLDIFLRFGQGEQIDVEMQMISSKEILKKRMIYYLTQIVNRQLKKGDKYTDLKRCIVLFILNFNVCEDEDVVHYYRLKDKKNRNCFDEEMINFVIVELKKGKEKEEMTRSEKYVYALNHCFDPEKRDKMKVLQEQEKGIRAMVEQASQVSEDEKRWIQEMYIQRNEMDENQRIDEAYKNGLKKGEESGLKKGEVIGLKKGELIGLKSGLRKAVYSMSQKGKDALDIADLLDESIEVVQEILNEKESVQ